jgi:ankyrin repeat protein
VAAIWNQPDSVKCFLAAACDPNARDLEGNTPLHHAVRRHNIEIVRLLAANQKVDLNAQNAARETPLHLAVRGWSLDIVRLLAQSCDLNVRDAHGLAPLLCAIKLGHSEIVEYLAELPGIDPTATGPEGFAAAHFAAMHVSHAMMHTLYRLHVFNLAHRDESHRTPFELAQELECVAVCSYLRRLRDPDVAGPLSSGSDEEDKDGRTERVEGESDGELDREKPEEEDDPTGEDSRGELDREKPEGESDRTRRAFGRERQEEDSDEA